MYNLSQPFPLWPKNGWMRLVTKIKRGRNYQQEFMLQSTSRFKQPFLRTLVNWKRIGHVSCAIMLFYCIDSKGIWNWNAFRRPQLGKFI